MSSDLAHAAIVGKRQSRGRSRLGCFTCRAKHVKCDERLPVCRRCERLNLTCSPYWTNDGATTSRRLSSTSTSLRKLQPSRRLMAHPDEPATEECSPQSNSNDSLDWAAFDDLSDAALMAQCSRDDALDLFHPIDMGNVPARIDSQELSALITSSPPNYEDTMDHMMGNLPLGSLPFVNQIVLSQTLSLSDSSFTPSHEEYEALRHYQDGFCLVHTSKVAAWSFPVLLLQKVSYSAIAIRCALAVSLQDLDMRRHSDHHTSSRAESSLAISHFTIASSTFREVIRQSTSSVDHVETLATFYFHYVFLTHQRIVNREELHKLSGAVLRYLQVSSIGEILTRSTSEPAVTMTPPMGAFLCRMLLWVYREDVYAMGYRCAGEVARYISERPRLLRRLCVASRPALQLNWGTVYPAEQHLDDVFSAQHLDMLVRMIQLQFQITEFGWSTMESANVDRVPDTPRPPERNLQIEEKFDLIETDFAPTFQMIKMPDDNYQTSISDHIENASVFVTIYYAWKMVYYRCAGLPEDHIQDVLAMLMQAAQHTIRKVQLKDLQRALLAAVIETKNPIHRDWILTKLGQRWRTVLENVLDKESRHGKCFNIWNLYELASVNSGN